MNSTSVSLRIGKRVRIASVISSFVLVQACDASVEELPTRSQCIVGAILVWPSDESDANRELIVRDVLAAIRSAKIPNLAAIRVQETEEIYAIFEDECQLKDALFANVLQSTLASDDRFPEYETIEGPIQPRADTILVYGEKWQDGQFRR